MRSGRTREAARCMDFAMPPVHVLGCQILCDFYTCTTGFEKACGAQLYGAVGALHSSQIWHALGNR